MDEKALYVYGVLSSAAPDTLFQTVRGVDRSEPVALVRDGAVAAIVSRVRLGEFGEEVIEANLQDPSWLAEKARAHDDVLAAAAREVTVLPFRFGAIYRSDDQIHALLRERNDFASTLTRLEGMVEFGLKTFVNVSGLRSRLAADRDVSEDVPAGRAYMERKKSARELEEAVDQFASECARATHERLAAVARDARLNALREQEDDQTSRRLVLNAAYLVARADGPTLEREIRILARRYSFDAVEYELTGPWPPYNFTDEVDRP